MSDNRPRDVILAEGNGVSVERFDYSRVGTDWAVLRLLARLGADLGAPADAGLVIRRGLEGDTGLYHARASSYERRLLDGAAHESDSDPGQLLWRASFAVPLAAVEYQQARFAVTWHGGFALALPTPGIRILGVQPLRLAPAAGRGHAATRIAVAGTRQRLIAVATAVAVTTTSTPAAALAASGNASNPISATARAHAGSVEHTAAAKQLAVQVARQSAHKAAAVTGTPAAAAGSARTSPASAAHAPAAKAATAQAPAAKATAARAPAAEASAAQAPAAKVTTTQAGSTRAAGSVKSARARSAVKHAAVISVTTVSAQGQSPRTLRAGTSSTGTRHHRAGVTVISQPMATIAPVKSSRHTTATIHELTHPKVTHIFSAPASPAPHPKVTNGPAGTGAAPTSTGTTGTTPTSSGTTPTPTGTTGTTPTPTGTPGTTPTTTGTTGTGTNPPATPPKPVKAPTVSPPSTVPHGRLQPTPPTPLAQSPERPSSSEQPPGDLSATPPVALAPRSTGGVSPTGSSTSTGGVPTWSSTPGFTGPASWTGSVSTDPNLAGAVSNLANLLSNGNRPPQFLIPIYMEAGRKYGVPWQVLAAINAIESDYGRNLSTSSAGAVGWMQFEPSTWKEWGVAADGHSVPNPYDPRDAIFSAARYLAAAGAARDINRAVFAYNHANWYVEEVMARAHAIATHALFERASVNRHGTFSVFFATHAARRPVIRYRGGLLSHYDRIIAAANMVSAANFPYVYGGGHEQPAVFAPFDCSGSVSYVMQQAGYKVPTTVSGEIPIWKFPAGPGRVTIFYNPVHTFMRIGNRYFGTSGMARPGGGAGWFDTTKLPASYLGEFREVHVPRLGANSFAPPHPGSTNS